MAALVAMAGYAATSNGNGARDATMLGKPHHSKGKEHQENKSSENELFDAEREYSFYVCII